MNKLNQNSWLPYRTILMVASVIFIFIVIYFSFFKQQSTVKKTDNNGYPYYRTATPTVVLNKETGWAIYKSKTDDFTIEYPADWKIRKSDEDYSFTSPDFKQIGAGEYESGGYLELRVGKLSVTNTGKTPEELLLENYRKAKQNAMELVILPDPKISKIKGSPAITYDFLVMGIGKAKQTIIYNERILITFSCYFADKSKEEIEEVCDRIIVTILK